MPWKCTKCNHRNGDSEDGCMACGEDKPKIRAARDTTTVTASTKDGGTVERQKTHDDDNEEKD